MATSLKDIMKTAARRNDERRKQNRKLARDELASQERRTKMQVKPQMQEQERKDREYWANTRTRLGQEEADRRIYDVMAGNAPMEQTVSQFSKGKMENLQQQGLVGGTTTGGRGGGASGSTAGGGGQAGGRGYDIETLLKIDKASREGAGNVGEPGFPAGLRSTQKAGTDEEMTPQEVYNQRFNKFLGMSGQTLAPNTPTDSQGRPATAGGFLNNLSGLRAARDEQMVRDQAVREDRDKIQPGLEDFTVSGVGSSGQPMGASDQSYREWLEGGKERPEMTTLSGQKQGGPTRETERGYLKFSDRPFEGRGGDTPTTAGGTGRAGEVDMSGPYLGFLQPDTGPQKQEATGQNQETTGTTDLEGESEDYTPRKTIIDSAVEASKNIEKATGTSRVDKQTQAAKDFYGSILEGGIEAAKKLPQAKLISALTSAGVGGTKRAAGAVADLAMGPQRRVQQEFIDRFTENRLPEIVAGNANEQIPLERQLQKRAQAMKKEGASNKKIIEELIATLSGKKK